MSDEPSPPASPGANILLVDDRPADLLALEALLTGVGDSLVRASGGEQALSLLAERDFAVVLLDVRMPGLTGFETARRMRASDRTRHTPVVFLSAAESDEFPVVEAYRLGAVDYLVKPLVPDILRAKVAVFVDLFRNRERVRALERRERERAEEALRETERRFARFMEHLPGLAWIKDLSGRYLYANGAAERAFGLPRADLSGRTDDEVFPPETAAAFRANDRRAMEGPDGVQTVESLTHPDGTVHHSLVNKFAIPGPDGNPAMIGGVAVDVTDRARAEEALRVSEERFRTIVEATPECVKLLAPDGTILQMNPAGLAMVEADGPEAVIGKSAYDLVAPADRDAFKSLHERVCRGVAGTLEHEIVGLRGTRRRVEMHAVPLGGAGGWTHLAVTRDVTERRRAEEAVRDAVRRKDEFMAMLAHELRNPLAPLRNALHILAIRGGDPEVTERVRGMMDRQVGHLSRLVGDLLDVSRITTGKVQLKTERLDLARLVQQAVADHRAEFDAGRVSLRADAAGGPAWVRGDPTRLAQVLDNLLTNALKFSPEGGGVTVAVATEPISGRATVAVRDNGVGIEPGMLARLFEPFSQADRTLDRSAGGLGLGLAIVKGLVELHGGRVRAESGGLGLGSVFTVTLPVYAEPPALSDRPVTPRPAATRLRVLVVEDNRDAADSLRMLLEAYGYLVDVAYTGPDGLRAAERHPPEVVICDIGLPGLDGYGVAAALRRNPTTAAARLIALTGYGQEEDKRRAKEAGFDEHLTKPADPAALESLLTAVG